MRAKLRIADRAWRGRAAGLGARGLALTLAVLLAVAPLTACQSSGVPRRRLPPPTAQVPTDYRVGPPDRLFVSVLPEPAIERDVTVRPDGKISFDLVGDLPAQGRTVDEIAADIEKRISRYKRGATVTVWLASAQANSVTVLGEVANPLNFPLAKVTRVSDAVGVVGGVTAFASKRKIRVIRAGSENSTVLVANLTAILDGDQRSNWELTSGDIVYVPPTAWARIGYSIQAILFPFQPFLGLGMSIAGSTIARSIRP